MTDLIFDEFPTEQSAKKLKGREDLSANESELYAGTPPGWPEPLAPDAFHGLAGEFTRVVGPESESDPVALLAQFLVAFGSVVGHGPHFVVEATPHYMNMFALMVGATAKARKGTSWGHVASIMGQADLVWAGARIQSGLSSGEGLIEAVRDAEPSSDDDEPDLGVSDKRLLVTQGEFAAVLAVMARAGNTLSSIIRDAWDHGNLRTMTRKQNALHSRNAHISILAHITRDEVRRSLDATEMANGFANRFLWIAVRRSKLLPEGGHVEPDSNLQFRIGSAVAFASKVGRMHRDDRARKCWSAVYGEISRDVPGLLGSVLARAEAQVLRLSCIYALLDSSAVVREEHLKAALALWEYAEESARYIFGDALGDPVADSILAVLRETPGGMTRTEISGLFGRNKSAERIQIALEMLLGLGKARRTIEPSSGRPIEVWFASTKEQN